MPDPESVDDLLPFISFLEGKPVSVEPLAGGLTNRNFLLRVGDKAYVVRMAGAGAELLGIDRGREVLCQRAAAALGVAPAVAAFLPEHGVLVKEYTPGRTLTAADFRDEAVVKRVAQSLRRCHDAPLPDGIGAFSPFAAVRSYHRLALQRNVALPARLDAALARLVRIEQELDAGGPPSLCHNDLLPGNFIDDGAQLRIIDWEYAGAGDRFFDLGNLAANLEFGPVEETALLDAYFDATDPDHLRRLRLMRLASDLREGMWGFVQAGISQLHSPEYYIQYGCKHLDRFLTENAERMGKV